MLSSFISNFVVTQINVLDVYSELVKGGAESDQGCVINPVVEVLFVVTLDDNLQSFVIFHGLFQVLHESIMWGDLDLFTLLFVKERDFLLVKFSVLLSHYLSYCFIMKLILIAI